MNDKVDHRRKAVCCMCGTLKRPFCWAYRGLEEQPFCSWKCRELYLYGPDVGNKERRRGTESVSFEYVTVKEDGSVVNGNLCGA